MDEIMTIRTIESFLGFIIFMLGITFIAFMLQFISNVIIIKELPAIKKYTQRIFEKLYNFNQNSEIDEKNKVEEISIDNNISKENEDIEKQVESLANNSEMPVVIIAFFIIAIIITVLSIFKLSNL